MTEIREELKKKYGGTEEFVHFDSRLIETYSKMMREHTGSFPIYLLEKVDGEDKDNLFTGYVKIMASIMVEGITELSNISTTRKNMEEILGEKNEELEELEGKIEFLGGYIVYLNKVLKEIAVKENLMHNRELRKLLDAISIKKVSL